MVTDEVTPVERITQAIADNASSVKSTSVDGMNVQQHSIKEQIEAAQYIASEQAVNRHGWPFRIAKMVPGRTDR